MGGYVEETKTVSEPRESYEVAFANITDDELAKVDQRGMIWMLAGFTQYSKDFNAGTLPSQRIEYKGGVVNTDPVAGTSERIEYS